MQTIIKTSAISVVFTLVVCGFNSVSGTDEDHMSVSGLSWLKSISADAYTIQLAAFGKIEDAKAFIASHKLNTIPHLIFNNNEQTYKIVYSQFETKIKAQKALSLLPRSIQLYSPWIRKKKDILENIQKIEAAIHINKPARESAVRVRINRKNLNNRLAKGQRAFNRQNYETSYKNWLPLAQIGMAEAQYNLGFLFESGWGVDQDYTTAFNWYRLSAEQGFSKSQFNLGKLYESGLGVRQDLALSREWIKSAANNNDNRAKNYLAKVNRKPFD